MKSTPISPDEVEKLKINFIPSEVFECFNKLIVKNFKNGGAIVYQIEVMELICEKLGCDRNYLYENNYLDVEFSYNKNGWDVSYEKPGHEADFKAYFTFTVKK